MQLASSDSQVFMNVCIVRKLREEKNYLREGSEARLESSWS